MDLMTSNVERFNLDGFTVDKETINSKHVFVTSKTEILKVINNGSIPSHQYIVKTHFYKTAFYGYSVSFKKPYSDKLINVLVETENILIASKKAKSSLLKFEQYKEYNEYGISKEILPYPFNRKPYLIIIKNIN